jgi:hypothetical protein
MELTHEQKIAIASNIATMQELNYLSKLVADIRTAEWRLTQNQHQIAKGCPPYYAETVEFVTFIKNLLYAKITN